MLALGADRAVLLCDEGAAGSDLLGTARVLAAALAREQPDLTIFGQQSEDGVGGVLVAAVAEPGGRPFVSQAAELEVDEGLRVTRQTEAGDEVIEAPLPALVSVSDAINEPRYTSLKGVMAAKRKPLVTMALAELGLAAQTRAGPAPRTRSREWGRRRDPGAAPGSTASPGRPRPSSPFWPTGNWCEDSGLPGAGRGAELLRGARGVLAKAASLADRTGSRGAGRRGRARGPGRRGGPLRGGPGATWPGASRWIRPCRSRASMSWNGW